MARSGEAFQPVEAAGDEDAAGTGRVTGWIVGRRTKYLVLVLWLVVVVIAAGFAGKLDEVQTDNPASTLPASAESAPLRHQIGGKC